MTKEEAIYLLRNTAWLAPSLEPVEEAVDMATEALKVALEPVEEAVEMAVEALRERPRGKWILEEQKSQNHIENIYICSSCRNFEAWGKTELYNYCPNCGALMEGDKNEHIKERTDANV